MSARLRLQRFRFGRHHILHMHVRSGWCLCHPSFLPSGVLGMHMDSTVSPRHPVRCVCLPIVDCQMQPRYPTVTGRRGLAEASYTVSSGTSGQQSHTSQSCAPSSSKFLAQLCSQGSSAVHHTTVTWNFRAQTPSIVSTLAG